MKIIERISAARLQLSFIFVGASWGWYRDGLPALVAVLVGWVSWLLPTLYFIWRRCQIAEIRHRERLLWLFWRAELAKWSLAILLIYLSLVVANLSYGYFLLGFTVAVFYFAFEPLWRERD